MAKNSKTRDPAPEEPGIWPGGNDQRVVSIIRTHEFADRRAESRKEGHFPDFIQPIKKDCRFALP